MHSIASPLLWTTMMTGRGPLEHRILDFTRARPTYVYLYSRYLRWRQRAATALHRLSRATHQPA